MSLLTVEQASERLGTSARLVRRLVVERRITFVRLGRHIWIDTADLDAFVAAGRVELADRPNRDCRSVTSEVPATRSSPDRGR